MNTSVTYEGGCHCGRVRFRVNVDKHIVEECNCSICRKKGFLHLIVQSDRFTLLSGFVFLMELTGKITFTKSENSIP